MLPSRSSERKLLRVLVAQIRAPLLSLQSMSMATHSRSMVAYSRRWCRRPIQCPHLSFRCNTRYASQPRPYLSKHHVFATSSVSLLSHPLPPPAPPQELATMLTRERLSMQIARRPAAETLLQRNILQFPEAEQIHAESAKEKRLTLAKSLMNRPLPEQLQVSAGSSLICASQRRGH